MKPYKTLHLFCETPPPSSFKHAISRTSAVIIVLVVIVLVAVGVYLAAPGPGASPPSGVMATIIPSIYNQAENVGVLNNISAFNVTISNYLDTAQIIFVNVTAPSGQLVFSQAVNVSAHDRTTLDVREPLIAIGTYAVTVGNHNYPYIGGYSFNVVLNTDQADLTIDQKSQQMTANTEAVIGAVTGVIGTVIGTFSLVTSLRPKRDKDQKKSVAGPRAKAFCSNCGAPLLDPNSQFCSRCGAPVETMMNRS